MSISPLHEVLLELLSQAPELVTQVVAHTRGKTHEKLPIHIVPSEARTPRCEQWMCCRRKSGLAMMGLCEVVCF